MEVCARPALQLPEDGQHPLPAARALAHLSARTQLTCDRAYGPLGPQHPLRLTRFACLGAQARVHQWSASFEDCETFFEVVFATFSTRLDGARAARVESHGRQA